jgi:hypothetical protein
MALWQSLSNLSKRVVKAFMSEDVQAPSTPPPVFQLEVEGGLDIGPHGQKKLGVKSGDVVAYVSRHGFQQRGVTCPRCEWLAAKPGEWEKLHENQWGEYVACGKCGRMLYASPNDDEGDPKPGVYGGRMPPEYFKFARPEGWKPPRQRTTADKPKVGDWVVIEDYTVPESMVDLPIAFQPARCLDQQEGRILTFLQNSKDEVEGARIALGGNEGIAGAHDMGANIVTVPAGHYFVMVLPTFRVGDHVRLRLGPHEGKAGIVVWSERARMSIRLDGDGIEFESPLVNVERIITNERPH